jgi:hypothetical protein
MSIQVLQRALDLERNMRDEKGWPVIAVEVQTFDPVTVKLFMQPSATETERGQAQAFVDSWDWRKRRKRPLAQIMNDIQALTAADRQKLFAATTAWLIRNEPDFAKRVNLNIEGEEPEA